LADWQVFKKEHNDIINNEMAAYNAAYEALKLPAIILKQN
jgi:hypothetical protein